MLELPEAFTIAGQLNETVTGKVIAGIVVGQSPHKLAWYYGEPENYSGLLVGKTLGQAVGLGGLVRITAGPARLLFGDGVGLRYHAPAEKRPSKHQMLIEFEDSSALSASVQMYGGLGCFVESEFDNPYYKAAKEKPSPLSDVFNEGHFQQLTSSPDLPKLSVKAFLATEQRVPGVGNGVLQDILWDAQIHPKRKMNSLSAAEQKRLYLSVKTILTEMARLGGRDTERDLLGNLGGYRTVMSRNNAGLQCPACGGFIQKENYLGGSIYFCGNCQKI
jgi:formamidopyrimidine-DNA glycosylase